MPATQASTGHILTPDVYLNHFSPAEAHQEEMRRDITMVLIGVALWDVLAYIRYDIKIIRESRVSFVIFFFILSRIATLIYMFSVMIARTVPVEDYNLTALWYTSVLASVVIIIASSYLFLRRVLAIYDTEKWVRWCFIGFWAALAITAGIIPPLGGTPIVFPEANFYMSGKLKPWVASSDWGLLVFDTAVVVAVSLKLGRAFPVIDSCSDSHIGRVAWHNGLTGKHLPRFTRAILRGGQLYYLVTVGIMVFVGIVLSLPMVPPVYGDLLAIFFVFFTGSMACRVFRNMKLFDFDATESFSDYVIHSAR